MVDSRRLPDLETMAVSVVPDLWVDNGGEAMEIISKVLACAYIIFWITLIGVILI
jgi:hypothetical protein